MEWGMVYKSRTLALLMLVIFVLIVLVLSSLIDWKIRATEIVLIVALSSLCALPFFFGYVRKNFYIFEPVYIFSFCTFAYFVVVPVVLFYYDDFYFGGVNYRPDIIKVLGMTILSLITFYLGYYWRQSRSKSQLAQRLHIDEYTKIFINKWSYIFLAVFTLLIVIWVLIARIPVSTLWVFGQASYGDAWNYAEGPQVGYLYGAREAIPACILMIIATRRKPKWSIISIIMLISYTLILAGPGGRYYALLPTLGAIVFYFFERRKSPKIWQLAMLVFVLFYFLLGGLGYFRASGNEIGEVEYRVSDAWDTVLEGTRLVVSTAASVRIVPRYENYLLGYSFLQLFTQPIPRFLWPDKPSWFGPLILLEYWEYSAAAPFWVSFYLNFGPLGVIVGCVILGILSRQIFNQYFYNPENVLSLVLLSMYIPFMIHAYSRGSNQPGFVIYSALYVMLPIILMKALVRWRSRYRYSQSTTPEINIWGR